MDITLIPVILMVVILVIVFLAAIIIPCVAEFSRIKSIAESKGYDGKAWGRKYIFSLFNDFIPRGSVLNEVTALPNRRKENDPYIPEDKNSWKCGCGIVNPGYTGTCSCGRTKDDPNAVQDNGDNFEKIREYKKLLDDGIITEDEFEQKKSELLKL